MSSSAFEKMEKYFIPRLKMPLHIIEVIMIIVAIILAGVRLTTITTRTRTDMMAIAMGAKSLVVIAYQLLSEHVAQWKRFASLKANLILNALEIVFWAAVAFMAIQSNTRSCKGASCGLGWGVLVIAILIRIGAATHPTPISAVSMDRLLEDILLLEDTLLGDTLLKDTRAHRMY
uniref:MARVEL domain-containing protein n=1 Tax=Bionectria ochroleuca TaxID=29856 RepID=A0A0B7JQ82_BIOOC